ncbi:MAG: DUF2283 domain-containing protein, partial [Ignisphaera sp.]
DLYYIYIYSFQQSIAYVAYTPIGSPRYICIRIQRSNRINIDIAVCLYGWKLYCIGCCLQVHIKILDLSNLGDNMVESMENTKMGYREARRVTLDLMELEKATVIYDNITNSLHIVISDEEADEILLLENNIVVKLSQGRVISLTIQDVLRSS